jgi:cell wall-associated NlpC family hydrolase
MDAPARLRYRCTNHAAMNGAINVDGNQRVQPPANNLEQKFEIRTANFNVLPNRRYAINTNNGSVTATLPVPPAVTPGDAVFFADAGGAYAANSFVILAGGGTTITNTSNASSGTLVINTNGDSIGLFWSGSTWRMYE